MIAILVLARRIADAPPETRPKLDFVGAVLSAPGLALFVFGVLRSSVWGWVQPKPGRAVVGGPLADDLADHRRGSSCSGCSSAGRPPRRARPGAARPPGVLRNKQLTAA